MQMKRKKQKAETNAEKVIRLQDELEVANRKLVPLTLLQDALLEVFRNELEGIAEEVCDEKLDNVYLGH